MEHNFYAWCAFFFFLGSSLGVIAGVCAASDPLAAYREYRMRRELQAKTQERLDRLRV
jgi:hypothetical protein